VQKEVKPFVQQQSGNKGAYFLIDREGGKALTFTIWESEEAALATDPGGGSEPVQDDGCNRGQDGPQGPLRGGGEHRVTEAASDNWTAWDLLLPNSRTLPLTVRKALLASRQFPSYEPFAYSSADFDSNSYTTKFSFPTTQPS
jgi:hypothetical protein